MSVHMPEGLRIETHSESFCLCSGCTETLALWKQLELSTDGVVKLPRNPTGSDYASLVKKSWM